MDETMNVLLLSEERVECELQRSWRGLAWRL